MFPQEKTPITNLILLMRLVEAAGVEPRIREQGTKEIEHFRAAIQAGAGRGGKEEGGRYPTHARPAASRQLRCAPSTASEGSA
jgi:hypothetical protein